VSIAPKRDIEKAKRYIGDTVFMRYQQSKENMNGHENASGAPPRAEDEGQ
jgi:hypothetical protein